MRISAAGLRWCLLLSLVLTGACSVAERSVAEDGGPLAMVERDSGRMSSSSSAATDAAVKVMVPAAEVFTSDASAGRGAVDGTGAAEPCAEVQLQLEHPVPDVWLLIDGSGSMGASFGALGADSRWSELRGALLDPATGLVATLQSRIAFGLLIYDGGGSLPGVYVPGVCPRLVEVPPVLDNFTAIAAAYPELPLGASTPTHFALQELEQRIAANQRFTQAAYVLLATDGVPNVCDFHDGLPSTPFTEEEAVQTVRNLVQQGTQLYAISLAGSDPILQAHLDAIAEAGGTGLPAFSPDEPASLNAALTQILGETVSCQVPLSGRVRKGGECSGSVLLDGEPLACGDDDGFWLDAAAGLLELRGAACTQLRKQPRAELQAIFPCEQLSLE